MDGKLIVDGKSQRHLTTDTLSSPMAGSPVAGSRMAGIPVAGILMAGNPVANNSILRRHVYRNLSLLSVITELVDNCQLNNLNLPPAGRSHP
jgi:hypothetical protein